MITTSSYISRRNVGVSPCAYPCSQGNHRGLPLQNTEKIMSGYLHYTPIEKTVVGQELIQMGRIEGIEKGEVIGKIHLAQRLMKRRITAVGSACPSAVD